MTSSVNRGAYKVGVASMSRFTNATAAAAQAQRGMVYGRRLMTGGLIMKNMAAQNTLKSMNVRKFSTAAHDTSTMWRTVSTHPNSGLKYLGAAGALGIGAMIAYGLSQPANYVPAETRALMSTFGGSKFAKMVRERVMSTYAYLTGSLMVTGATSFLLFTRGWGYRVLAMNPMMFGLGTLAALWGSIALTQSIDYHRNPVGKHAALLTTNMIMGLSLVGLGTIAGAQIIKQAAMITGCAVGGMSAVALASPSDEFLRMGPYLGVGLGVVIAASLGGMFFPHSSLLMNVSLYGGLGLFGLFTAHDAQRVLHDAQTHPEFDPIGEQMGLYMDTINIMVRVTQILMMQQNKRR